jgi:hypothetical protein
MIARWVDQLVKGGWDPGAAERVVRLNEDWWRRLSDIDPTLPDVQIALLRQLRPANELAPFLREHPEAAGLLLSAADPLGLATLLDRPDYCVLAGLFARYAAEEDVTALTQALGRHQDLICRLQRRGLLGSEVLFLQQPKSRAARVYDRWLADELTKGMTGSAEADDALISFFHFALASGPFLRDRLIGDEKLCRAFPELWRKLSRVVSSEKGALEYYFDEPGLWDTLAHEDGEKLLQQWGPVSIQLLHGEHAYPEKLRPQVVEALLQGDATAVEALFKFREDRLFRELLRRNLTPATRIACMQRLLKEGPNAPGELRRLQGMTNDGVARHVGPPEEGPKTWLPLYSSYAVYEKWQDGRDISAMDWVMAIADPASTLLPGGKVVSTGVGQGARRLTARQAASALKPRAVSLASRTLARQDAALMEKASNRMIVSWGASQALHDFQREVQLLWKKADRLASLDVTRAVQFAFKRSGMNRETFKRLTDLEARLFMRPDARVRVMLLRKQQAERLGKVADEIQKFLEQTSGQSAAGQSAAAISVPPVSSNGSKTPPARPGKAISSEDEEQQRKNISAWWLMHASGLWGQLNSKTNPDRP